MLDIRRTPDYAEVLVEKAEENDATLCYEVQNDRVNVYLSAPMSHPKIVKLRWKAKIDSDVRVLGDAWERSYADLGFIGLTTEKAHPWHFIMKHGGGTDGIDIAVSPASFVSRVVDCEGVTAFCDVRSGSIGVELGDRELFIGSFMSVSYSSDRDNSFEAACDFCKKMCPDPVLPTEPVYGDNNWCYRNERTYAYNVLTNIAEVAAAHGKTEVEEIKRKQRVSGFNSIFAVSSVSAAKLYYDEFKRQMDADPTKKLRIAIVYSYGANEEESDGILDEENPEDISALDQSSRDFLDGAIRDYNETFHTNYDTSSDKFQNYYILDSRKGVAIEYLSNAV